MLVLGGGVVGVTSAWYLAGAGHRVQLVERHSDVARETSFANGAQISAGHAEPWARPAVLLKLLTWLGREDAPLLFRPSLDAAQWAWAVRFLFECLPGRFERNTRELVGLALYSRECLRALREQTKIAYDEIARGILHLCTDPGDFAALARHAEAMQRFGVQREVKSAAQCVLLEPALADAVVRIEGGVYTPQDESGDAHLFSVRLRELLQGKAVEFHFDSEIVSIESDGDLATGVQVSTQAGKRLLRADAYVVALGSYSPRILARLGIASPVYPLKGYSITLGLDAETERFAPSVSLTDEARKIVISRLGSRLRAAGTAELAGYDLSVNTLRCAAIEHRVRQFFPKLGFVAPAVRWAGLRPATPNNLPVIGLTRLRNLYQNTGHGTLGWTLACGSGRAIADIVSKRKPGVAFRFAGL